MPFAAPASHVDDDARSLHAWVLYCADLNAVNLHWNFDSCNYVAESPKKTPSHSNYKYSRDPHASIQLLVDVFYNVGFILPCLLHYWSFALRVYCYGQAFSHPHYLLLVLLFRVSVPVYAMAVGLVCAHRCLRCCLCAKHPCLTFLNIQSIINFKNNCKTSKLVKNHFYFKN